MNNFERLSEELALEPVHLKGNTAPDFLKKALKANKIKGNTELMVTRNPYFNAFGGKGTSNTIVIEFKKQKAVRNVVINRVSDDSNGKNNKDISITLKNKDHMVLELTTAFFRNKEINTAELYVHPDLDTTQWFK